MMQIFNLFDEENDYFCIAQHLEHGNYYRNKYFYNFFKYKLTPLPGSITKLKAGE